MTAEAFRALALGRPEAIEGAHMGLPDFRIRNKLFATLGPDESWGRVKLTPQQQSNDMASEPEVFRPASGARGRGGATIVQLKSARKVTVQLAVAAAWRNTAPKEVLAQHDEEN